MANDKEKLNSVLNQVFDYIDWYKVYDNTSDPIDKRKLLNKYTTEVSSLLIETKTKAENYFKKVVDQPIYKTNDFLRLRKFLIYWYASFNCVCSQIKQTSDIDFVDKGSLLRSLGYELYTEHSDIHQKTLCTQLSDMWSQKGTPLAISKIVSMLDVNNFTLYEYWLDIDKSDNELRFTPVPIEGLSYNTGTMTLFPPPIKPFLSVTAADPHWFSTEDEIREAEQKGEIGLPSLSPYVGIVSANDWVKNSRMATAYADRVCNDTYREYCTNPKFKLSDYQKYYFHVSGENISLLEVFISIGYVYNSIFNRKDIEPRDGVTQKVPHFNGEEEALYDEIQFITEYNNVFKKAYSRKEKDQLLKDIDSKWHTLSPITCWNYDQSKQVLSDISPDTYKLCNSMIGSGQGYDFLIELLTMFDFYISHDIGLTAYSSIFMLFDPLKEYQDKIRRVFDCFKPIHTRLLDAVSYMVVSDVPGDCFAVDEKLRLVIYQKLYEYYNELSDYVRYKIYQRFRDDIGRGYPEMIPDMVNLILNQRIVEPRLDIEDKQFILNMNQLFVEFYTLYKDDKIINYKQRFRDRYKITEDAKQKVVLEPYTDVLDTRDDTHVYYVVKATDREDTSDEGKYHIYNKVNTTYFLRDNIRFINTIQRIKENYSTPDVNRYPLRKLNVEHYVLAEDTLEIIVNASGITFDTNTWSFNGNDYYITYDDKFDKRIGDVLASIRDTKHVEIEVVTLYTDKSITLRSDTRFNGSLVLKQIDAKIPISQEDWDITQEQTFFTTFKPSEYGLKEDTSYMLVVLNEENVNVEVSVTYSNDLVVLESHEVFNGKVLIVSAEVSKTFDEYDDWSWSPSLKQYVLTLNPHLSGLHEDIKEYIASVRNENNEEIKPGLRYDFNGNVEIISSMMLRGSIVVAGDLPNEV